MTLWPRPIPAWFWAWANWRLGRDEYKGHGCDPDLRPSSAPGRIPAWAWARLALLAAGRPAPRPAPKPIREKALDALRGKLGTKESPAGSNRCWASAWYGMVGPWCAMSASWAYVQAGSSRFKAGVHYAYVPYIVNDAKAGRNGLSITHDPKPGDLVTYDWEGGHLSGLADHVGLFERWVEPGRWFYAIEGNTSTSSNSNGGEVMRRQRSVSDVCAFVTVTEA